MSWGFTASAVKPADVVDALKDVQAKQLEQLPFDSFDDDLDRDMATAISVAGELAGELDEEHVNVSVGGHRRRAESDPTSIYVNIGGAPQPPKPAN